MQFVSPGSGVELREESETFSLFVSFVPFQSSATLVFVACMQSFETCCPSGKYWCFTPTGVPDLPTAFHLLALSFQPCLAVVLILQIILGSV